MTHVDRCGAPPAGEELRAIRPEGRFSIALSARPPPAVRDERSGQASPTERHDAIVGLAQAVFARGGELVVPADPDTAPLLAAVALGYASPPPLTVVETEGEEPILRSVLTPYMARDAVSYVGRRADPDVGWPRNPKAMGNRRHPVTPLLVERSRNLRGAVFVSPTPESEAEIHMLVGMGTVQVAVLTATASDEELAERWRHYDPVPRLLARDGRGRRRERERWPHRPPVVPYAFVMQELIRRWTS
jgi:hypothetical protein